MLAGGLLLGNDPVVNLLLLWGTGVWSQGSAFAREVLYHQVTPSVLLLFVCFSDRVSHFCLVASLGG
jgi:hypothetical protein